MFTHLGGQGEVYGPPLDAVLELLQALCDRVVDEQQADAIVVIAAAAIIVIIVIVTVAVAHHPRWRRRLRVRILVRRRLHAEGDALACAIRQRAARLRELVAAAERRRPNRQRRRC